MGLQLLRQFYFLKSTFCTTLFSAKSLTAISSFHLNLGFYVVPQRMSSRITLLPKNCFPIKSDILYCSQEAFNRLLLPIYPMCYRKKRGIFLKKHQLCTLNDNWECIMKQAEDGCFGKKYCLISI